MKTASIVARQHHEKWDGTGYPQGLAGENIHIYRRIAPLQMCLMPLPMHDATKRPGPFPK
ncbi:MAG: HD domain-containing phosphohydrolase [Thermodesulfobacteriota bacterium]|nr:HD domain-containing phosphohydrolase [Thermodesulfobacteriota bacterium]